MNDEGTTTANQSQPREGRAARIGRIVRRSPSLAAVAALQIGIAGVLRVASLARVRRTARRLGRAMRFVLPGRAVDAAWAIEATGRRLGTTCLTRAVAAEMLLDPLDGPISFCLGVARDGGAPLRAHAWIARADRVVVGGPVDDYVLMAIWRAGAEHSA
jgi:hypothetical protein